MKAWEFNKTMIDEFLFFQIQYFNFWHLNEFMRTLKKLYSSDYSKLIKLH